MSFIGDLVKSAFSAFGYDGRWKTEPTTEAHYAKLLKQVNLQGYINEAFLGNIIQSIDNSPSSEVREQAIITLFFALRCASDTQKLLFDPAKLVAIADKQMPLPPVRNHLNAWLDMGALIRSGSASNTSPLLTLARAHPDAVTQEFFDLVRSSFEREPAQFGNKGNKERKIHLLDGLLELNPALMNNYKNIEFMVAVDLESKGKYFPYSDRNYMRGMTERDAQVLLAELKPMYFASTVEDSVANRVIKPDVLARYITSLLVAKTELRSDENIAWIISEINSPSANHPTEGGARIAWKDGAERLAGGLLQLAKIDPVLRRNPQFATWVVSTAKDIADRKRYTSSWMQTAFKETAKLFDKSAVQAQHHRR